MAEVTVIVPVYNTEKYLAECIMSVIKQTFSDWKLILVNDGSQDRSEDICNQFVNKDKRISLISQENMGIYRALRNGIFSVQTPYTMFLDSDDIYSPEMIRIMLSKMKENDADCVHCGYVKFSEDGSEVIPLPFSDEILDKKMISRFILTPFFTKDADIYRHWSAPRWNKIYRTELLKEIYNKENSDNVIGEDLEVTLRYLSVCEKVITIGNQNLYRYRVLQNTISRGYTEKMYSQYKDLTGIIEKTAFDLGFPFTARSVFEDRGTLNMLTELAHTENLSIPEKKKIRARLISDLHDKKLLYKLLLNYEFPGKAALQRIYRAIRNR